jgi:acyl homoserine lactone synthase
MATVSMGSCSQLSTKIMNLMHEFRREVFVRRLGWSLPLLDGMERDEYDTPDARYVVITDAGDRVTACARLLPTTKVYMLPELFPQLLGSCIPPRNAAVWELSRFATSVRRTHEGRILSLSKPTLDLLELVFEFSRKHNITRLVLVTSVGIERLMLRAGVPVHRVAQPAAIDGSLHVALFIEIPPEAPARSTESVSSTRELEACA